MIPVAPAIRIVIVDDHPVLRRGVAQLLGLERDMQVVAEVGRAGEVAAVVAQHRPQVVLLDLTLPDGDGLGVLKDLAPANPRTGFLVLTMHDRRVYADRCLKAGARGFLTKDAPPAQLMAAIRAVAGGRTWVAEPAAAAAADPADRRLSEAVGTLSDRQLEVFRMIGEGQSTRDIAARMQVSVKTVEAHKEAIKARLGASGAPDLLRLAMLWRDTAG